jgi:two-component system, chemotaxis family, chemotaxis protein CheY
MPPEAHILDDSRVVRAVARAALESLGLAVTESGDAEAALVHCRLTPPHFILADWHLPGMNGLDFIRALRSGGNHATRIVLCSTEKSESMIRIAFAAGADRYLAKPFGRDDLADHLQQLGIL